MKINSKEIYSDKELFNVLEEGKEKGYRIEEISCKEGNVYIISENEESHTLVIPSKIEKIEESVNSYLRNLRGNLRVIGGTGLKDISYMFYHSKVNSLNLSSFDTSKVENMSNMFYGCKVEKLNLSDFDTSKVENMSDMFEYCQAKELDLSSFNTSNVKDMSNMFCNCQVEELDLSSFNTLNVEDMSCMFAGCKLNSLDLSSFDTSKVENMINMFFNSEVEEIKLPENKNNNKGMINLIDEEIEKNKKRNFEIDETDFEEDFELE